MSYEGCSVRSGEPPATVILYPEGVDASPDSAGLCAVRALDPRAGGVQGGRLRHPPRAHRGRGDDRVGAAEAWSPQDRNRRRRRHPPPELTADHTMKRGAIALAAPWLLAAAACTATAQD